MGMSNTTKDRDHDHDRCGRHQHEEAPRETGHLHTGRAMCERLLHFYALDAVSLRLPIGASLRYSGSLWTER